MRQFQGIPKALFDLPARVVPGLVLLAMVEYASRGTLWARLLAHVSAGRLDPGNVWAFAVTTALVLVVSFGPLLDALGKVIEAASDALLRRPRSSGAFEWLQVHAEHAADLAEEKRMRYRLLNALCATFLACAVVAIAASLSPYVPVALLAAAAIAAWRGMVAKTEFRDSTERFRRAALAPGGSEDGEDREDDS